MESTHTHYLPAAGRHWALPLYDPFVKLFGGDRARGRLLNQAALGPHLRVLDVGCGTGTLAAQIARYRPVAEYVGLDPDDEALARARKKVSGKRGTFRFDQGFATQLPYENASFDRVFSAFMFHHLESDQREKMLVEVRRVLRVNGSFHLLDFERPHSGGMLRHLMHSSERLVDNSPVNLLRMMKSAGFARVERVNSGGFFLGLMTCGYYKACIG